MKNKLLFLSLLLMPFIVLAESFSDGPIAMFIFMEAFVSIHMSIFVLMPLSRILSETDSKRTFWTLFLIRVVILLFFDFIGYAAFIAVVDFLGVFLGAFIIVPIIAAIKKKPIFGDPIVVKTPLVSTPVNLKCIKCGAPLKAEDKFCPTCGEAVGVANAMAKKTPVSVSYFDSIFNYDEEEMLDKFISKEMVKAGYNFKANLIPSALLRRKNFLNIIFSLLIFIFICMIFFHFPIYTYLLGILILLIFKKLTSKYDIKKYLIKEVKSRPSEKISNIVMNLKNTLVEDDKRVFRLAFNIAAGICAVLLFIEPRIIYEELDDGYSMRYYAFGVTNFTSVTIPEEYNGKPVISLRGNAFSNMYFLKTVTLPDSITEIRGQAFKNCFNLESVNIPSNLKSIGGASFYNCKKIESVSFPDSVTEFGGEMFKNASSLKEIKLPENISEIRGNSFENCTSLEKVTIPDSVTRIGGHAFYNSSNLRNVSISKDSKLVEIGSSAFRLCPKLTSITIPSETFVNERAFKESPTKVNRYGEDYNPGGYDNSLNDSENISLYSTGDSRSIFINEYDGYVYIKYINYEITPNLKTYSFRLSGELHDEFTISSNSPSYIVNDDLTINLDEKNCYGEKVSLIVNHN